MFNIRFWVDYLRHRLTSKTRHGTHSPFVYRLVDEVIYDFSAKNVYAAIEQDVKRLPADKKHNKQPSPQILKLIYRLVANHQPENIIELGDIAAVTSVYLHHAAPDARVYSSKDFQEAAKIDLAYIYGDQSITQYFNQCLPLVHNGTMLMVDGIYKSEAAKQAWAEIKAHQQVVATIDLFWIGLVFFKNGQAKEDFKIRF